MEKKVQFFLFVILLFFFTILISAASISNDLHLNIQTTTGGAVTTGTFNFVFNISNSSNCSAANVVYSNSTTLTTDSRGVLSYYLPNVSLDYDKQYWLCYYRDGNLINNSKIARTPYTFRARNITLSGVEVDSNFNMGNYNFTVGGGWTSGGVSILGGDLYAQTGYFYNITSLNVTRQNLTINENLYVQGRIGIGTATPTAKLNVVGNVSITTDLLVDTNTLFVDSDNDNVGIGTTTPNSSLDSTGTIRSTNYSVITSGAGIEMYYYSLHDGSYLTSFNRSSSDWKPLSLQGLNLSFNTNGTVGRMMIDSIGRIGVGTTNVSTGLLTLYNEGSTLWHLRLRGGSTEQTIVTIGGEGGSNPHGVINIYDEDVGNKVHIDAMGDTFFDGGDVGIGTTNPTEILMVNGSFRVQNSTGTLAIYVNESTGNVGIRTTTPVSELQVAGDITQASGQSIIKNIVHKGIKENYAGNTGLGQSTEIFNSWSNYMSSEYADYYSLFYGTWGDYQFSGGVWDGEYLWMVPSYSPSVVRVNPATGEMTNYSHGNGDYAFYGGCFDGDSVWFSPFNSDNFMKIDPDTGVMTNYTNQYGSAALTGCVLTGEEVVFIPEESDKIVAVNVSSNTFRNVSDVNISAAYGLIAFNGGVWDGEYLWMVPYSSPSIVRVNVTSGELTNYTHGCGVSAYVGGCFDGELIWFAASYSDTIDSINPSTGEITKYTHGEGNDAFIGCTYDGISLWFAPLDSSNVIKMNPRTGQMVKMPHNQRAGGETYRGAVFDGESVWFIPFQGRNLTRIRPPELGRNSIFTSRINVGKDGKSGNFDASEDNVDIKVGIDGGVGGSEGNIKIGNYQIFVSSSDTATYDDAPHALVIQTEDNPEEDGYYQLLSVQSSGNANRFSVIHGVSGYANQFRDSLAVGTNGYTNCSKFVNTIDCGIGGNADLYVADDIEAPGVYARTSGSAANVYIDSNGVLYRSTASSEVYKSNIRPYELDTSKIWDLDLKTYELETDLDYGKTFHGFIAEEVAEIFPDAAIYDRKGNPESIEWNILTSSLIQENQMMRLELCVVSNNTYSWC